MVKQRRDVWRLFTAESIGMRIPADDETRAWHQACMRRVRCKVLRSEHHPITSPRCGASFQVIETKTASRSVQRPAARQPEAAPRKTEPTSPEPTETLIEEVDEDDADVSEIIGERDHW
jgi:hypothetical protein